MRNTRKQRWPLESTRNIFLAITEFFAIEYGTVSFASRNFHAAYLTCFADFSKAAIFSESRTSLDHWEALEPLANLYTYFFSLHIVYAMVSGFNLRVDLILLRC